MGGEPFGTFPRKKSVGIAIEKSRSGEFTPPISRASPTTPPPSMLNLSEDLTDSPVKRRSADDSGTFSLFSPASSNGDDSICSPPMVFVDMPSIQLFGTGALLTSVQMTPRHTTEDDASLKSFEDEQEVCFVRICNNFELNYFNFRMRIPSIASRLRSTSKPNLRRCSSFSFNTQPLTKPLELYLRSPLFFSVFKNPLVCSFVILFLLQSNALLFSFHTNISFCVFENVGKNHLDFSISFLFSTFLKTTNPPSIALHCK